MVDDLKEYAESLYSDEAFAKGCEKYSFAKPFTKESLLYRDIFEKYYPGQAEMEMCIRDRAFPLRGEGGTAEP